MKTTDGRGAQEESIQSGTKTFLKEEQQRKPKRFIKASFLRLSKKKALFYFCQQNQSGRV
ncbi:hypothetical protein [Brevibacillus dissolubilis]|uniref:hypothetical protein n=1 Tax=Brevibacillus dissolubilis TaxID=1844116 RepID=UPI0011171E7D|nr:hypothetical protein [Brevibacillus dissolubilis]